MMIIAAQDQFWAAVECVMETAKWQAVASVRWRVLERQAGVARLRRDIRGWLVDRLVKTTRTLACGTAFDFDHLHGVDTQRDAAPVSLGGTPVDRDAQDFYEATAVRHFRHVVNRLPRPYDRWSFVDIGSGKGRVVMLAMAWPFRRVEGIEFRPDLHATAMDNLHRYKGRRASGAVTLTCGNAVEAPLPEGDLVVYFYNALNGAMLEALLDHLERSAAASGRRLLFIYSNPVERFRVDRRPAFRLIREGASPYDLVWWGNRRFVVYALGDPDLDQRA